MYVPRRRNTLHYVRGKVNNYGILISFDAIVRTRVTPRVSGYEIVKIYYCYINHENNKKICLIKYSLAYAIF